MIDLESQRAELRKATAELHAEAERIWAEIGPVEPYTGPTSPIVAVPAPELSARQKAALGEVRQLHGYLRKGRNPRVFEPMELSFDDYEWICREIAKGAPAGLTTTQAKARITAAASGPPAHVVRRAAARDRALDRIRLALVRGLGSLVQRYQRGGIEAGTFVDLAARELRNAMASARVGGQGQGGVRKADETVDDLSDRDYETLPEDVQSAVSQAAEEQKQYLKGFLDALILGMTVAEVSSRVELYGAGLTADWERGYIDTASAALTQGDPGAGVMATWVALSDPCRHCAELDGKFWPVEKAPIPGAADFGPTAGCLGGPNCRCSLALEVHQ